MANTMFRSAFIGVPAHPAGRIAAGRAAPLVSYRHLQGSVDSGVEFNESGDGGLRIATLARPRALNALNLDMVRALAPVIQRWNSDPATSVIVIDGAGDKAFCAGGDVVDVAKSGRGGPDGTGTDGGELSRAFFREEYILDHMLARLDRPYVALIDGITMGGGVGISMPADFRVATERTLFAMPETAIGLFPDVGGSFYLPRLEGQLGMFLALTGARLKGEDVVKAGVATHYIPSDKLDVLLADLAQVTAGPDCGADVQALLQRYDETSDTPGSFRPHMAEIEDCFGQATVAEVLHRLATSESEWAAKQKSIIDAMSPTSLELTHRQLRLGATMTLEDCFQMEYRMTQGCMRANDFYEGIRALLIDKDRNPQWDPATLSEVTPEIIDEHFSPVDNDLHL